MIGKKVGWWNLALLVAGAASGAMGLAVLLGAYTESIKVLRLLQAVAPLQYNAALGFILCGAGLLAIALERPRLGLIAGAAATIGLLFLYYGADEPARHLIAEDGTWVQTPLAMGLIMALLLAVAIYFAQIAWSRAQEAEAVNRELQRQVAERKQAEEVLKASQDYARSIIDSSLDMIIAVDKERRIIEFNKAAQQTFGYRPEEVMGKHVNILYADPGAGLKVHKATMENNREVLEVLNRRKNGEVFPSYLSAAVLRDAQGEPIGVMGISRDVTAQKRAEEATQNALRRLRALHDIETAIASTLDLDTVLRLLLEKIDGLFHFAATTVRLINPQTGQLEPVACRNLNEREWKAQKWHYGRGVANGVLQTKAPVAISNVQTDPHTEDVEFFRRNGLVSYLGVPVIARGETLGVLDFYTRESHYFTSEEIEFLMTVVGQAAIAIQNSQLYDEMRTLAAELAKSNRVKDEFLSVMSHELRTPLNVVMGYTGMVRDGMFGEINAEQKQALEKVLRRAKDQLTMISSILEATRMEVDKVAIEPQVFGLRDFMEDLRSAYDLPLDKPITIRWEYPADLPEMRTDRGKLNQILENLINNAIKFTEKGSVTVSAWYYPLARAVEFKVADTGIGIPAESQQEIFEIFRQVDSSETRQYGGVGLGLYIVKKLTDLLGGKVKVESKPGYGSTFTVKLPIAASQSGHAAEAAA